MSELNDSEIKVIAEKCKDDVQLLKNIVIESAKSIDHKDYRNMLTELVKELYPWEKDEIIDRVKD